MFLTGYHALGNCPLQGSEGLMQGVFILRIMQHLGHLGARVTIRPGIGHRHGRLDGIGGEQGVAVCLGAFG